MKRLIAFITGLLALFINLSAKAQHKEHAADNASLLWRISGKGLAKPSYLFGTIHAICAADFMWTSQMNTSLAQSDKVCFEMDLDDPNVMMQVAAGLMDNSGKQLSDYFTPEQYKLLQHYLKDSIGMDISMLAHMKPVFLQTLIATKTSIGCPNPTSYEDSIMKMVSNSNKEILGLETAAEQLAVLETLPTDSVVQQLMEQVKGGSNDDDKKEYDQMITAYQQQNLPELFNLITQSKELGNDIGPFLDDRNRKWIARMDEKMKTSNVFFAVGAGHLWGDNGVISLLKKQGYTVEPVH